MSNGMKLLLTGFLGLAGLVSLITLKYAFEQRLVCNGMLMAMALYTGIALISGSVLLVLSITGRFSKTTWMNTSLVAASILLAAVVVEIVLRNTETGKAYVENRANCYLSAYAPKSSNVQRTYAPNTLGYLSSSEFNYPRQRNNLGFSDHDFHPKGGDDVILIQTYGDSFTEGDGAPADSSYPAMLRSLLKSHGMQNVRVQNFGICGSDPAFSLIQFEKVGQHLNPDVAIFMYGSGDLLADFIVRGGLERFDGDHWRGYPPPAWEWVYAASYVSRPFFNVLLGKSANNFLLTDNEMTQRVKELQPKWNEVFQRLIRSNSNSNMRLMLIRRPEKTELLSGEYQTDFAFFDVMLDTIPQLAHIDLMPFYQRTLLLHGIDINNLYWPMDGHHNSRGYQLLAEGVFEAVRSSFPELFLDESAPTVMTGLPQPSQFPP